MAFLRLGNITVWYPSMLIWQPHTIADLLATHMNEYVLSLLNLES